MSLKTIVTHGSRVCGKCNGKIEKGVEAKADFERTPYYFEHIRCPGAEAAEDKADDWEMLFAILADHSNDLIEIKAKLRSIYEAQFPATIPDMMGAKK